MKKFFKVAFLSIIGIFFLLIVVVIYLFVSGNDDEVSTGKDSGSESTEAEAEEKEEAEAREKEEAEAREKEEAEAREKAEEEKKEKGINDTAIDFDGLPLAIKVHLATSIVDERANAQDLTGFTLYYNIVGDNLFVRVHSGAGTGHPIFKIQIDSDTITPIDGVMSVGPDVEEVEVNSSAISKEELYNNYTKHKDIYDAGQSNVKQDAGITTEGYKGKKALLQ